MKTLIPTIFTTLSVQPQAFTYKTASQNWKVDRTHPLHEHIKPNPVIHLCDHGSYIEANTLDVLGTGNDHGGSTVYEATLYTKKNSCGEKIALKRIRECKDIEKLALEVRAMKDFHLLRAPCLNIRDTDSKFDCFIPMQLINGDPLSAYFEGKGSDSLAKDLFGDVAGKNSMLNVLKRGLDVISEMHGAGWLHKDLHPGNIMIDSLGEMRIIDFGRATKLDMIDDSKMFTEKELSKFAMKVRFYMRGFSYDLSAGLEMILKKEPTKEDFNNFDANLEAIDKFVRELNSYS